MDYPGASLPNSNIFDPNIFAGLGYVAHGAVDNAHDFAGGNVRSAVNQAFLQAPGAAAPYLHGAVDRCVPSGHRQYVHEQVNSAQEGYEVCVRDNEQTINRQVDGCLETSRERTHEAVHECFHSENGCFGSLSA